MGEMKAQRGRPKGSGIDDTARLAEIRALIGERPGTRPTTAIRMLGVSDPSAIRRLRDKFNATAPAAAAPVAAAAEVAPQARPRLLAVAEPRKRAAPARPHPPTLPAAPAPAASAAAAPTGRGDPPPLPLPVAALLGIGVAAAQSALELQLAAFRQVLRLPNVEAVIRQQLALSEMMVEVATRSLAGRRAVH
jgi:hypothetical protein